MLSATVATASILISIITIIVFRQRERKIAARYSERQQYETGMTDAAIVSVITLLKELMDEVCLSGDNPQLLMSRLNRFIIPEDSHKGFINWIQPMADIHCNGIISYLKDNYRALTRDDLNLCALLCLGFPSHSLQKIFNQNNSASLYNRRSRIRKKIGIPDGESTLEKYLQSLTENLAKTDNWKI